MGIGSRETTNDAVGIFAGGGHPPHDRAGKQQPGIRRILRIGTERSIHGDRLGHELRELPVRQEYLPRHSQISLQNAGFSARNGEHKDPFGWRNEMEMK